LATVFLFSPQRIEIIEAVENIDLMAQKFRLEDEKEIYKKLYEDLLDFGQDDQLPSVKLDFVKARVFDTTVLLNRLKKSNNTD